MHRSAHDARSHGFTLVELLMGMVVFVVAAVVLGNHISVNYATTAMQRNKVFAFTKAQAMLSELHAFVDRGEVEAAIDLDILDDGISSRPTLSVARDSTGSLITPNHPLSGNLMRDNSWVWARRISVRPFAGLNNRNVRYVTVRILKRDRRGALHELASLSSVVNSVGSAFPATQEFDVYLLAVENIPGWWVFMEAIVPFLESAITDLENRNPGLSLRTHWITKSSFGRNRAYRPHINDRVDSHQRVDDVYYYPGAMPPGNSSNYYYVPDLIKARVSVDGETRNGYDPDLNPFPYALADFYNHAMRYPRAKELHDQRVQAVRDREEAIRVARANGMPVPAKLLDMSVEPPLQVLLEEMAARPDQYRHALLINLHGELLPAPSLRNYSDAARIPDRLPDVRVVTHPEELRTQSPPSATDTTDVVLRVYAYTTEPDAHRNEVPSTQHPILLEVMDVDLTDGTHSGFLAPGVKVESLAGGIDGMPYEPFRDADNYMDTGLTFRRMGYAAWFIDHGWGERKSTVFVFYNTPVACGPDGTKGLYDNERSRLYGLEYVPSSPGSRDFSRDLASDGDGPKNTARWRITVPGTIWDDQRFVDLSSPPTYFDPRDRGDEEFMLTMRTRLYDAFALHPWWLTGQWSNGSQPFVIEPENLSETYTWWAPTRDAVPFCERAQFQGDPRHNPYRDMLNGDPDFGDGYNWFHDSLTNNLQNAQIDFPGIVRTWNRWNGAMRQDVPRLFELFRAALVNSQAIYTTLTGYSYYYVGVGNEIGYDSANGYPNSIPTDRRPWGGGGTGFINNITGARNLVRSGDANYWWGIPWLGELYPDWVYDTDWMALDVNGDIRGNLRTGTASNEFYRQRDQDVYNNSDRRTWGTAMHRAIQRTSTRGCVSFFNIGRAGSHFNHHFTSGDGNLVGAGLDLRDKYGFPMPSSTPINRPFSIDTGGNDPEEYNHVPYVAQRYTGTLLRQYYNHGSGHTGSGLVQITSPDGASSSWIVVNGLAQTTTSGTSFIAKFCLLSLFQSYFELGDTSLTHRVKQLPRVEIGAPTEITELVNPPSIDIQIDTEWLRWDRLPYTRSTPSGFAEDERDVSYVVLFSPDLGRTWRYIQDSTPAVAGQRPSDPAYLIPDAGVGTDVVRWGTPPAGFPEGVLVLLRVEAYRSDMELHYSVHQVKIYIERG